MQKQATDFFGELSDSHACVRDAGKQEERNRILVEIVLALDRGGSNSWVRAELLQLKHFVENPRSKEEQDRLLLESIMAVAIRK